MKKIILYTIITSTLFGLTCLASEKSSHENLYLRLDAGKSKAQKFKNSDAYINDKLKTSNIISLGIGKYLDSNFRTDLTVTLRDYKLSNNTESRSANQKIKSTAVMLNGYYDIDYFNMITPYLSAGLGMSHNNSGKLTLIYETVNASTIYNKKTINNLAWQVGAGTAIKINDSFNLDLSYKFINLGKVKTTSGVATSGADTATTPAASAKLKAQEITAGLRFNF